MVMLYLIKQQINVILEYDYSFIGISCISLKSLYDITENIKNNFNKVIHISFIENNLTFKITENNKNIKFEELSKYELYSIEKVGDKTQSKIINIKNYLSEEEYKNNKMDDDIISKFQYIQSQLNEQKKINEKQEETNIKQKNEIDSLKKEKDSQKNEINSQKVEIEYLKKEKDSQKKEIDSLKGRIEILENNLKDYKGRFIYKAFCDYIYLIFNININLKNKEKISKLLANAKDEGCDLIYILPIIKIMKSLYFEQTEKSHFIPSCEEVKNIILSYYNEEDDIFIFQLFERLKPEEKIIEIIKKNNDLTKLLISSDNAEQEIEEEKIKKEPKEKKRKKIERQEEKEKKKNDIISEINNILSMDEKKNSIKVIKKINQVCDDYYNNYEC